MSKHEDLAATAAAVAQNVQDANRRVTQAANGLGEVCAVMPNDFHAAVVELLEALRRAHELASGLAVASADPASPTVPLSGDHQERSRSMRR